MAILTAWLPLVLCASHCLSAMVYGLGSKNASASPTHLTSATDEAALLSFKSQISHDPGNVLANWEPNSSFCSWFGVSCSRRRQRITAIQLNTSGLVGTLSPYVGNLSFLSILNLTDNSFHGSLPGELGRLTRLRILYLASNQLEGRIPPSLGYCQQLQILSLATNKFRGTVPSELGSLQNLRVLLFGSNELTWTIPPSLGNLTRLEVLYLGSNMLQGEIPHEIGQLVNLKVLVLQMNNLTGMVPSPIFNITSLQTLALSSNRLSGQMPLHIGLQLPNLQRLYLGNNLFTGPIPSSMSNASNIVLLDLSFNSFSGPIPMELGSLPLLTVLNLLANQLTVAPNATELTFLTSLANCTNLRYLILSGNRFNGALPASIGKFSPYLQVFATEECGLLGSIPQEIGNLTGLIQLVLSKNFLSSSIPATIGQLRGLQALDLSNNRLLGPIPTELFYLQSIGLLFLHHNTISGPLPNSIGNMSNLQNFSLSFNRISSVIPSSFWNINGLSSVKMANNNLTGILPVEVGKLKHLNTLDLSRNEISGRIPNTFGELQMLSQLNLSWNALEGWIPESFGKLLNIESIDVSKNSLVGTIPKSLERLSYLQYLNFSFNRLEGDIPSRGVFENLTAKSFLGNPSLCGAPKFQVPACSTPGKTNSRKKHASQKVLILVITLPVACLVSLLLCLLLATVKQKKARRRNTSVVETLGKGHMTVTYYDLARATDNFNEENLLGVGSFGSVYKGILRDGTVVAVKVINVQSSSASRTFDAECRILSKVRHRNLVKIITTCSNLDFRALVLQFMPNGSLDQWLHSDNKSLGLLERLDIMIDVASAMEYLHHGFTEPIIHCDMKPSNVLLDDDMTAHVGDFGIAKLLVEDKTSTQTGTLGTIGYIAPEYGLAGKVSTRSDVYSFGVTLLEAFTRRKPTDPMFNGGFNLRNWVDAVFPHAVTDVADRRLMGEASSGLTDGEVQDSASNSKVQVVASVLEVGLVCTVESPEERMDMVNVVARLKKIRKDSVASLGLS